MAEDSQSTAPEEPGEDLGQQLVQRAAAPGVIRRDLAARIQRSCCVAETGLATEIQRRFAPAASAAPWDQGPALPYAGSGGFGGFGGLGGMSSGGPAPGLPAVQAKPASPMPVARTVGAPAAGGAAAEALAPLGSSLQRRHLGTVGTAQSGVEMVQRRPLPGSPSAPTSSAISTPISTSSSSSVQRSGATDIPIGPAIVRRSVGSPAAPEMPLRRMSEPEEAPPAVQSAAPPSVQASPARAEMGPAIVHRSAVRAPIQRVGAAPSTVEAPVSAAPVQASVQRVVSPISPGAGAGMGLPLAQPARLQPAAPSPSSHLPFVQAASGRGDARGGIVQRAAGPALPLARQAQPAGGGGAAGGGVVQRQAEGGSSLPAPAAGSPGGMVAEASVPEAATGGTAAAGALDLDDVVEQVMRRLKRSLAVESERHGGRRWP